MGGNFNTSPSTYFSVMSVSVCHRVCVCVSTKFAYTQTCSVWYTREEWLSTLHRYPTCQKPNCRDNSKWWYWSWRLYEYDFSEVISNEWWPFSIGSDSRVALWVFSPETVPCICKRGSQPTPTPPPDCVCVCVWNVSSCLLAITNKS